MKRLFLFLYILSINLAAFAFETNSAFGIKKQDSPEGYQQYVGKEFIFRRAYGSMEPWDYTSIKYPKVRVEVPYTIVKVKVKDVKFDKIANREITIEAIPTGGGSKIKFKGYEEVSIKTNFGGDYTMRPLIGYMPIYFTEPYREFTESKLGTFITDDLAKDRYEIVDIHFIAGEYTGALCYKTRNQRTGAIKNVFCNMPWMAFEDAYEGKYKTALVKVETLEDSDICNRKIGIFTANDVEKYSFKDSLIDVEIFGDQEQFNFVLKNVSPYSLKIIWDEASFVGIDGKTSKIKHDGTKYTQTEQSQPATTVIRDAKLEDFALPASNIHYKENQDKENQVFNYVSENKVSKGTWVTEPMLPKKFDGTNIGKIRLMLPIQIKDEVNEYTFVFNVFYVFDHPELIDVDRVSTESN